MISFLSIEEELWITDLFHWSHRHQRCSPRWLAKSHQVHSSSNSLFYHLKDPGQGLSFSLILMQNSIQGDRTTELRRWLGFSMLCDSYNDDPKSQEGGRARLAGWTEADIFSLTVRSCPNCLCCCCHQSSPGSISTYLSLSPLHTTLYKIYSIIHLNTLILQLL